MSKSIDLSGKGAIIFGVAVLLARQGVLEWITAAVTTFVWPLSPVTRRFALARFFRSFALLLGGGLHVTRCIESAAAVTANPYIERKLLMAVPLIKEGATLVEAFDTTRQLTPMAREMLHVGEESGNLEIQMKKISEYHLDEATQAVAIATRVMSVVIFGAVAVLVAYILFRFYSGLYGGIMDELGI
ncbi:MAG: type II secretion system F family protein [candidate division Zixibacteria bacterium]|nr:type II secretion system F family protein [candidate division Zixibacteria bacterium]